jgi:hypothetical protein
MVFNWFERQAEESPTPEPTPTPRRRRIRRLVGLMLPFQQRRSPLQLLQPVRKKTKLWFGPVRPMPG